jgi:hypothetical protein
MDIRFNASQTVDLAVPQQPAPIQHYLRQPQRLVNALAASSQIEPLDHEHYRLKMRPLTFMMFRIQPTVDLKVWTESDGTVHVRSTHCEIRGFDYVNQRFALSLLGKLQPRQVGPQTLLQGKADLEVRVELPQALMFTPKSLLETTGNSLLKSVLLTIKQRLTHHLLLDYQSWAGINAPSVAPAPLLPENSSIVGAD